MKFIVGFLICGFTQQCFAISARCNFSDPIETRMTRMNIYNAMGDKRHPYEPKNSKDIEAVKELVSYLEECKDTLLKSGKKEMVDSLPEIQSRLNEILKIDEQVKSCTQLYDCQKELSDINSSPLIKNWIGLKEYDLKITMNENVSVSEKEKRVKVLEDYFNKCSCALAALKIDEQYIEFKKTRESIKKEYSAYLEIENQKKIEYEKEAVENQKISEENRKKKELADKLASTPACKKNLALLDYCRDITNLNSLKEAQKQDQEIEKRSGVSNPSKKRQFAQESILIENLMSQHLKDYNSYQGNVLSITVCKTQRAENGSLNHFLTINAIKTLRESLMKNCGTSDYLPE